MFTNKVSSGKSLQGHLQWEPDPKPITNMSSDPLQCCTGKYCQGRTPIDKQGKLSHSLGWKKALP